MSSETTRKFILDATAGFRMMWENKQHPNTIYLDERSECNPDIIGDFRDLIQFPTERFRLVVFDPPHAVRNTIHGRILHDFGVLKCETWQSDLKLGLKECMRVLKPYGILLFKWNTCSKKISEVKKLLPFKPLFMQTTKGDQKNRGRFSSTTVWFCFMKIPEGEI